MSLGIRHILPFSANIHKHAYRSSSYTVCGPTLSRCQSEDAPQNEIIQTIEDISELSTFINLISSVPIDAVIDSTYAYKSASTLLEAPSSASPAPESTVIPAILLFPIP